MLQGISKLLTGDILKVLCDMGHSDVLILADANFPGEAIAGHTSYGKLIRCPGITVTEIYRAVSGLFPLDVHYTRHPACVMDLTDSDKARNMPEPSVWGEFADILREQYPDMALGKLEREEFYRQARQAYAVIQTGEERQYGNLLLAKGVLI